jgi:hypothetical protein
MRQRNNAASTGNLWKVHLACRLRNRRASSRTGTPSMAGDKQAPALQPEGVPAAAALEQLANSIELTNSEAGN